MTGACRVDVGVEVEAGADGTGEVRAGAVLDAAAVAQLGGETPEKRLALADLADAGWVVDGPTERPDGGLEVEVRHEFDDLAEADALITELAGKDGPLRGFALSRERSFAKTTTRFRGVVDLTGGLGAFTDPDLRAALEGPNGEPLGVDDGQLARHFAKPVAEMFGFSVAADLPGRVTSNAALEGPDSQAGAARWVPQLGQTVTLEATSETWNVVNLASAGIAGTASVLLAGVLFDRRRRRRLPSVTS